MIKVLVVGGGRIALSHLPIISANPDVELAGIVETSFISRQVLKRLVGCRVFSSIDKVEKIEYDCVFILTPNKSHFFLAKHFLNKGKHVFIEKPLTTSSKDSRELLDISASKAVKLQVGYVNRFLPTFFEAKKYIADGRLGNIVEVNNIMLGSVVKKDHRSSWRTSGEGAGCLFDYGPHALDMGLFLFGDVESVISAEKGAKYSRGADDWFKAEIKHKNGITQSVFCDWADDSVRKAENIITVIGDKASLEVSKSLLRLYTEKEDIVYKSANDFDTDVNFYLRGEEFSLQSDDFFLSVNNKGRHSKANVKDAVAVDELIEEIGNKGFV